MMTLDSTGSETWVPLPDWPYSVSDLGQVRSDRTGLMLVPSVCRRGKGHLFVTLNEGSRRLPVLVHRLIAAAFLGPRPDDMVILHLNGIKADCRAENLRYCTLLEACRARKPVVTCSE